MDVNTLVKATALTSAGLLAGHTWALSDAAISATSLATEATQAAQWRFIYLKGFGVARPACLLNATTFGYLAYRAPPKSVLRILYIVAALINASGPPYAIGILRRTNGALSIRSDKLAGPGNETLPLTYAFDEERSKTREREWSTEKLVRRWQWHNGIRTVMLIVGTFVSGLAVALDR